jgi:hypothetical protein
LHHNPYEKQVGTGNEHPSLEDATMNKSIPITLVLLVFAVPTVNAAPDYWARDFPVPDISGRWYGDGDPNVPCQIIQWRLDGNAEFINQYGSRAWGTIRGNRVWIPDWTDGSGSRGLWGRIRGDRIIWPNGSYWSRYVER